MAKLQSNVEVNGEWFGPSYPDAGDPPSDANINPAAYAPVEVYDQHLGFREDDFAARGEPIGVQAFQELEEAPIGQEHPRAARADGTPAPNPAAPAPADTEPVRSPSPAPARKGR